MDKRKMNNKGRYNKSLHSDGDSTAHYSGR